MTAEKENITKCPTCNAPAKMTWSGLELVAESGDETLASKHYEFHPPIVSKFNKEQLRDEFNNWSIERFELNHDPFEWFYAQLEQHKARAKRADDLSQALRFRYEEEEKLKAEIERLKSERDELLKLVEAYAKDKP